MPAAFILPFYMLPFYGLRVVQQPEEALAASGSFRRTQEKQADGLWLQQGHLRLIQLSALSCLQLLLSGWNEGNSFPIQPPRRCDSWGERLFYNLSLCFVTHSERKKKKANKPKQQRPCGNPHQALHLGPGIKILRCQRGYRLLISSAKPYPVEASCLLPVPTGGATMNSIFLKQEHFQTCVFLASCLVVIIRQGVELTVM